MKPHNVDFIGGDFNMSASSTVGDVFTDPEFAAPDISLLWGLGAFDSTVSALGFSSCQSDHMDGVWIHTAATNSTTQILHMGPATPRPTFRLPSPEQAQQRRLERKASKHERRQSRRRLTQPSAP